MAKKIKLALQTFRLHNFKAVRDSKTVRFTPLTVFIGNNGSGKSSLIEGLETFQSIVNDGLDEAMNRWGGFEQILNKAVRHNYVYPKEGRPYISNPVQFAVRGGFPNEFNIARDAFYRFEMGISASPAFNEIFIARETMRLRIQDDGIMTRNSSGVSLMDYLDGSEVREYGDYAAGESIIDFTAKETVQSWQFLSLNPLAMGSPRPQKRTGGRVQLASDGSNLADYLRDIRELDIQTFDGIIESLRYVLPYAADVQPTITSELQRTVYLQLSEQNFKVPGWLLSTGTLRVLAILAVLRHPKPPPLLFIEEIENGLDPRTINLLVDEIQRVTQSGQTQVVCTTHSPYFLDLVPLSSVIVVERDASGQPTFTRPNEVALGEWAKKFAPGQLYTMSQLTQN